MNDHVESDNFKNRIKNYTIHQKILINIEKEDFKILQFEKKKNSKQELRFFHLTDYRAGHTVGIQNDKENLSGDK